MQHVSATIGDVEAKNPITGGSPCFCVSRLDNVMGAQKPGLLLYTANAGKARDLYQRSKHERKSLSMPNNDSIVPRFDPQKAVGSDLLTVIIHSSTIRRLFLPPRYYLSCVDLMGIFAPEGNIPRVYWNQQKRRLLAKDEELYQSLIQLKLPAPDGKNRVTDLVPDWAAIFLILLMDTPAATQFKKQFAKGASVAMSADMLKYRAQNIAAGLEWSADSINLVMANNPSDDEPCAQWWQR